MTKIALAASLVCLCISAHASDDLYSPAYAQCMDTSGGVTAAMHDCIGEEHARQDARLNAAYKKLTALLPAERKNELRAVQRLWIQYRDANCRFYADPDGGTLATLRAGLCGLEMTAQRAKELELLME
ncbi:lysozyme inhibitor LprI family protein [Thauera sp. SDU_THAU2]|uniref:lysozyme inhibitor LprI family protein n=1 Tax=Thauera sp. SDU_THAU2 TaxID=3136633 RepID=UPI00311DE76A